MINLDFIHNDKLKLLLERDIKELDSCLSNGAYKSVLVLSGSIIEASFVDYFLENKPDSKTDNQILRLGLSNLVDLAFENDLISQKSKDLSSVIRNYRNLIHPGVELRKDESFDKDTAEVANSLVSILLREIRENNLKHSGYKATDIINKFETDNFSYSIAENLIEKLSNNEKIKFFEITANYNPDEIPYDYFPLDKKKLITLLKPLVPRQIVLKELKSLLKKVEQGVQYDILEHYYLFHESLDILEDEEREIMNIYVMNIFKHYATDKSKMNEFEQKKIFISIGKNLETENEKSTFFELIEEIIANWKNERITYFQIIDQLLNSLTTERKEKTLTYIKESISNYRKNGFDEEYMDGDYFPF